MKASDICVGDWMNIYNFPNDNPKQDDLFPAKLDAVFIFEPFKEPDVAGVELIFKNKEGGNAIASRPLDTCLPIELTEEILEKNGFEYEEDTFLPDTGYWMLRYDEDGFLRLVITAFGIKGSGEVAFGYQDIALNYVHQLQHLLRLCGIEKEIEI